MKNGPNCLESIDVQKHKLGRLLMGQDEIKKYV
jgi:hypothetical protein